MLETEDAPFLLAPADRAYFGRKDYQQTLVVKKLVEDLNVPMEICVCPTVREPDGLAMSSRNRYLNPTQRQQALVLYESLQLANEMVERGERDVAVIRDAMRMQFTAAQVEPQYIEFVTDGTVDGVDQILGPTVVTLAAQVGPARLIDNLLVG